MSKPPLPPGPSIFTSLIWLGRLKRNALGAVDRMAQEWGDVVAIRVFGRVIVVVRGAEAAHHVLLAAQDDYPKSKLLDIVRPALGEGLVTSSGETWRRSRRIVQPLFAKRYLNEYADLMAGAAGDALDGWDQNWRDGERIDLSVEIQHIGLDTITRAIGADLLMSEADTYEPALAGALHEIGEMSRNPAIQGGQFLGRPSVTTLAKFATPMRWRRYLRDVNQNGGLIERLVDERMEQGRGERRDLLGLLIEAEDESDGTRLSRQQVIDEMATFIAAGHETTAQGLSWMFLLLSNHPQALHRLHAELDQVLAGETPTAESVQKLDWLTACLKEAMRLYPPVWVVPRMASKEDVIAGFRIPKGASVAVSIWSTHRDPAIYPNPTEFVPERWLGDEPEKRARFSYLPFGGGRRACVGQGFAMLNAGILGAMIAQRYSFEHDPTTPIKLDPTLTLRPHGETPVSVHRRTR
ncbi:MAG: cytochrome P450 [Solirubrobacterales bacterium]